MEMQEHDIQVSTRVCVFEAGGRNIWSISDTKEYLRCLRDAILLESPHV